LVPFEKYALGQPKLSELIVHVYADASQLIGDFRSGKLTAIEGLTSLPANIKKQSSVQVHNLLLNAAIWCSSKLQAVLLSDPKCVKPWCNQQTCQNYQTN